MNRRTQTLAVATIALVAAAAPASAACEADMNASGAVDFSDLLEVIGHWGPCANCPADLDLSGTVGFGDVLMVMGAWGPCSFEYGPVRDNPEAEQIGLELLGSFGALVLSDELYDRIDRDLDLIRDEEPALAGIFHSPAWAPQSLLALLVPGAPTDDFDELNAFYQVESVTPVGSFVLVTFPGNLNIPALLPEYHALASVQTATRNDFVGGANTWRPTPMLDGSWSWNIDHGFGDCQSGCICHTVFDVTVTEGGAVSVLSVQTQGDSSCPSEQ